MNFHLWQNAWREDADSHVEISLPDDWEVTVCKLPADSLPKMSLQQMLEKIRSPIGMPAIQEMARSGHEAVIVFDDMSRGTPVRELAELVVAELERGGIGPEHIRFLCALGNHAALTRKDFVKKLGKSIVERFPVYNHNPYENLTDIGTDLHEGRVMINREFMHCDVRIGIGSVSPHPMNGFGGGGKLIFPGIAGIETTGANHSRREFLPFSTESSGFRKEIEHMVRLAAPFFKIDALLNSKLEIVDLYAGDPVAEYQEAMRSSAVLHTMKRSGVPKDVVIVNANAKYNEALIAVRIAQMDLKPGGDIVLINHCPDGQVTHYLYSAFGSDYGGGCWVPPEKKPRYTAGRIIYQTPYPDPASRNALNEPEKVAFAKTWEEALALLSCHGAGTSVSLLPDGTISRFSD